MTKQEIINKAVNLINPGLFPLGETFTETSEIAFDQAVKALLNYRSWSFLTQGTRLTENILSPSNDYKFAFQKPQDFVRLLFASGDILSPTDTFQILSNIGDNYQFSLNQYRPYKNLILSNICPLSIIYIFFNEDEDLAHANPGFIKALVTGIKAELAVPLMQSRILKNEYEAKFEQEAIKAVHEDRKQVKRYVQTGARSKPFLNQFLKY